MPGNSLELFPGISGAWAQETLKTLTLEEKIGQLFIPAVVVDPASNKGKLFKIDQTAIETLIKKYHVGGILFLGKTADPMMQVAFTRRCQNMSKIPLLITQDLEWGLSMRLENTVRFARNMTLGALTNNELVYQMGKEVARQCRLIGVQANFAPVVDINSNPKNPIINSRSFGEDKIEVAKKAIMFMKGLQEGGIIACAKHFPGHGDTSVDSHLDLPKIEHSLERLHDVELFPFKKMIDAGVMVVMTAHLEVPALEKTPNLPATLSRSIVTDLLADELGFKGLFITDALNMNGVLKHHQPGELELKALLAGNDLLLCPTDTPRAIACIKQAMQDGLLTMQELDKHVLKILYAKEWVFKNNATLATDEEIAAQLHSTDAYELKKQLYQDAITLVKNTKNLIPLDPGSHVTCMQVGCDSADLPFISTLQECFVVSDVLQSGEIVIVGVYGLCESTSHLINELKSQGKRVVLVSFGSPYNLNFFKSADVVIQAYEDDPYAQVAAAKVIAGQIEPKGRLPVTVSEKYGAGLGL